MLKQLILMESIPHIEDLSINEFIHAVENLKSMKLGEKLDGSNLWFGVDEKGFFTSREGKGSKAGRFYSVTDYPMVSAHNGFRAAHLALQKVQQTIKSHLAVGEMVEAEIMFGRQPNTVTYGNDDKNFVVIIRGVETDQQKVDKLAHALANKTVSVVSTVISSSDGTNLQRDNQTLAWQFTQVKPVDTKDVDISAALDIVAALKQYLSQRNSKISGMTNGEVAEISLSKVDKLDRPAVKIEREIQLAHILDKFKNPIKEILLDTLVRKVKPFLQAHDLHPDEDIGVEGVVATSANGDMVKIVDKDVFTAINTFNNFVRSNVAGVVRTDDQDAPIELRGGAFGQAKIRIGELLGMKELALSSSTKKILTKFKGANAVETATKLSASLNITSLGSVREKIAAILTNALKEIDEIIDEFTTRKDEFKLKLKTGKELGVSPEVLKRNLTAFAETKRDINQIIAAVEKSRTAPELVMSLYGRTIQGLFSGSESNVKESIMFKMLKTFEDGEAPAATPAAEPAQATVSGSIATPETRIINGRLISRRPRKFIKKQKFSISEMKTHGLLRVIEAELDNKYATDVNDKVSAKNDIEFNTLRNNIKMAGDSVTSTDIFNYLDKAHELNDQVDSATFGMELDDGSVVKVFVNHTQADQFEKALAELLGKEDDIQKVIDELSNVFDIVDIEWPDTMKQNAEAEASDSENDAGIESNIDADGVDQVDPVIDLSAPSLLKQVDDKVNEPVEEPDLTILDEPVDDEPTDDEPTDDEPTDDEPVDDEPTDDEPVVDDEPVDDEPVDDEPTDDEPVDDEPTDDEPVDDEPTDDEPVDDEPTDDEPVDDEPTDDEPVDDEPTDEKSDAKKKKKKRAQQTDDAVLDLTTTKEGSAMTFGQRFKNKILAEKDEKPSVPQRGEKQVAAEDSHDFPEAVKKLMQDFPSRGSKMMVGLMSVLGVPVDAMVMKKAELRNSLEASGDLYMKDGQMRMWVKRVIDRMHKASVPDVSVQESLEDEMTSVLQKMVLALLKKIGLPDSLEKLARSALRQSVKQTAVAIQQDAQLRTYFKMLAEIFGVDGTTGPAMQEAMNHMGEREYSTYAGWRAAVRGAVKQVNADVTVWWDGDKDIAQAMIGAQPYARGKTWSVGEWDGAVGSVASNVDKLVKRAVGVNEAVGLSGQVENAGDDWISLVKQLALKLGIPEANLSYRENQVDVSIKKQKMKIKNHAAVQRRLEQVLAMIDTGK